MQAIQIEVRPRKMPGLIWDQNCLKFGLWPASREKGPSDITRSQKVQTLTRRGVGDAAAGLSLHFLHMSEGPIWHDAGNILAE